MHCPFCSNEDTQVKDSRPSEDGSAIRRRRACSACGGRFTTFERIQLRDLTVIKASDKRQPFDREKIIRSMQTALRKRPVEGGQIEKAASGIVRQLESAGEQEIPSSVIGGMVMKALIEIDVVGYIRYASVYKDFRRPDDFNEFLEDLKGIQAQQSMAAE